MFYLRRTHIPSEVGQSSLPCFCTQSLPQFLVQSKHFNIFSKLTGVVRRREEAAVILLNYNARFSDSSSHNREPCEQIIRQTQRVPARIKSVLLKWQQCYVCCGVK